jgi:hypothetical protein
LYLNFVAWYDWSGQRAPIKLFGGLIVMHMYNVFN